MSTSRRKFRLLFSVLILLLSCSRGDRQPGSDAPQEPIKAGPLQSDRASFEFAIYYLPRPTGDPIATLDLLLGKPSAPIRRVQKLQDSETAPAVTVRLEQNPQSTYAPPDVELLKHSGRGLTGPQSEALQRTEAALILDFAYAREHMWTGMRSALEVTHSLAQATGGLIWDEETREVFTPEAWKERRLEQWEDPVPDVSRHTTIHAYESDGGVRAITLGMGKFGLPDLVIEESSWSSNRNVGNTINLLTQALAEGAVIERDGEFDLNIRAIRNRSVREPQVTTLKENATGIALLTLLKGRREEGDADNRLIEITFDRGNGPDRHAKQDQVLSAAFGSEDSITDVKHDEELTAASERARKQLPALRARFNRGLNPGEYIMLKAPFPTPSGGREWMWVEVRSWKGDTITGLLQNDPFRIPDLHAGQTVEISEAEVFDFIETLADGTRNGNETGSLIERRSK